MSQKKDSTPKLFRVLLLPPDLTDGQHVSVHRVDEDMEAFTLGDLIQQWGKEAGEAEELVVKCADMTGKEIEELESI
jgi:hypothetical protein